MLPDVQTRAPDIKISLTRVGVSEVRKLLKIPRNGNRPIVLLGDTFEELGGSEYLALRQGGVAPRREVDQWRPWIKFNGGVRPSWRAGCQAESGVIGPNVVEPNK